MSVEESVGNGARRQRRKKKNSRFLRNAKGFGKMGIYGRGTEIQDDQYHYFIGILDTMKNGFESVEEKVNMANNVFEATKGQEVHLASNQIISKALESLMGFVEAEHLERLFDSFGDSFRPICSNPFASHVLQKMVEVAFLRGVDGSCKSAYENDEVTEAKRTKVDTGNEEVYNLETKFSSVHKENCQNFVVRVSKFMLNNLEDFVWDNCANHIIRTCVLSLAGIYVPKVAFKKSTGSVDLDKNKKFNVPDEWFQLMKEFPERLQMWPQFGDFPYQDNSSALLSTICISLQRVDKKFLKHFGKKILVNAFLSTENGEEKEAYKDEIAAIKVDSDKAEDTVNDDAGKSRKFPTVFQHQTSVILLETILTVAGQKLLTQLYIMLFAGRIKALAQEQLTNFAVQRLLRSIKEKEDFENIFTELSEHIEKLIDIGHTGVISELAAACLRLGCKQNQMVMALQSALHIGRDKEKLKYFLHCLMKLKPYQVAIDDKSFHVNLHGSLIIQSILKYNKPIVMVNCILETPSDQLATIFQTPNGSHIVDAFLQSKFVGEKSREKLIRHLEGFYVDLAVTKFGSRTVENLFAAAQDPQKARIAKELADKCNMLKGTPFGQFVHRKLAIDTYSLSAGQWKASLQRKENKIQELFKDIIK